MSSKWIYYTLPSQNCLSFYVFFIVESINSEMKPFVALDGGLTCEMCHASPSWFICSSCRFVCKWCLLPTCEQTYHIVIPLKPVRGLEYRDKFWSHIVRLNLFSSNELEMSHLHNRVFFVDFPLTLLNSTKKPRPLQTVGYVALQESNCWKPLDSGWQWPTTRAELNPI